MMGRPKFESQETKEVSSEIALKFFRHSIKENDKTKHDAEIRLTEEGRDLARSNYDPETKNAVAFGSSRKRAQETAGLIMSGSEAESLEKMEEELNKDLNYGSKLGVDKRLDFNSADESEYGKKLLESFFGGTYLKFLTEKSDSLARELGQEKAETYSFMASQIGEIVQKYFKAADAWGKLLDDQPDKYDSNKLERFLGTHQGVSESFLAKVIEKTKGVAERDRLVEVLNQRGFDYNEGFEVDIKGSGDNKTVRIAYRKELPSGEIYSFNEELPNEVLDEIVEEGRE
jgi:broad specificity phosphatase PhoE